MPSYSEGDPQQQRLGITFLLVTFGLVSVASSGWYSKQEGLPLGRTAQLG